MILWNPITMQWSLGGFAASGVVMTWSILAPFCALMLQNVRKAVWWFAAYLAQYSRMALPSLSVALGFDSTQDRLCHCIGSDRRGATG